MSLRLDLSALALAFLALAVPCGATQPAEPPAEETLTCLSCHEDPGIEIRFEDGSTRSLRVDGKAFAASVHGSKIACSGCHPSQAEIPHPERSFKDADEFSAGLRDTCKSCHSANYTRYLDSVHYRVLQQKGPAPSCVDCHDSHAVVPPNKPRTRISDTCSNCHSEIAETYSKSVHGRELAEHPADVPVCTDCHHAHDIKNPHEAQFLLRTPEVCGRCHRDAKLMGKYGVSTRVLDTYLADFHGMTASLSRDSAKGEARVTAVCVDCHGHHDIAKVDEPGSRVLKANLVKTCRQCHREAGDNFPAAWLSHFEPSLKKAPLVYLVKQFYRVFIPFVIGGLLLQVLLHVWRGVVKR